MVTDGNEVLNQAMYKSPLADFGEFYDDIIKNENTKDRYFTEDINGIGLDIPRNAVIHDMNKHNLSKKKWQGVLEAIRNGGIKEANLGDKTVMNGIPVKMVVDVNGVEYGVVFEHMKRGRNIVTTAFKDTDANIDNWIKNNSARAMQTAPTTQKGLLSGRSMSDIIASLDNKSMILCSICRQRLITNRAKLILTQKSSRTGSARWSMKMITRWLCITALMPDHGIFKVKN